LEINTLLKPGAEDKMNSYRPISLLPSLSKIFEKLKLHRGIQHFNNHHILVNEQFSFRQNYSTNEAILQLIKQVLNALNSKKIVGGIFCNLKKAFDCVDHPILLSKLKFYGITGQCMM
jgi:hypothetical protein